MTEFPAFGVVLVAVDDYPAPRESLPSSTSAARFAETLHGGTVLDRVVADRAEEIRDAFASWSQARDRPGGSIVYLVGHGTGNGAFHDFLVPDGDEISTLRTSDLAAYFQSDWEARMADPTSWTLFVLDCCDSELGVRNVYHVLTQVGALKPRRLALWPVAPGGASRAGAFVDAFERTIAAIAEHPDRYHLTENDTLIPLELVLDVILPELGDLEPEGRLPASAAIAMPAPTPSAPVQLDVRAELRRALAAKPPEVRSHFLAKAIGGEVGEVAWMFCGRWDETATLVDWLTAGGNLRVVTGEAGSGKSALLGHLVLLADPEMVELYVDSGLAPQLADYPTPPAPFDAVIHLTGKTAIETVDALSTALGLDQVIGDDPVDEDERDDGGDSEPNDLLTRVGRLAHGIRLEGRHGARVLLDALDEAQEPLAIAGALRQISTHGALRVLVGTRRSRSEGPDQPAVPARHELLDALGAAEQDILTVDRAPDAMTEYAVRRLGTPESPYAGQPEAVARLAERIAAASQPFLFARLATTELLAWDPLDPDGDECTALLGGGHRGLFAAALDRLGGHDRRIVDILAALAHARGRGLPRNDGIWAAAAGAVAGAPPVPDDALDQASQRAAPYIALDAEAGQSTYRLAHQTFVEHFQTLPGHAAGHRAIATALVEPFLDDAEGWVSANHYAVRYTTEHLVADASRAAPDATGLARLVTDPGWLPRILTTAGVDGTVELVATARATATEHGAAGGPLDVVDAVERTLRRSRTTLSRDPAQLPAHLHARLGSEPEPALAALGQGVASVTGVPWLRMAEGRLDWRADLETTFGMAGKIRSVACGTVDGQALVALAVDEQVLLWDPHDAVPDDDRAIDLDGRRATALAFATVDGAPGLVVSAGYDGITELRALDGSVRRRFDWHHGHQVAAGRLGGRDVIAGVAAGGEPILTDAVGAEPLAIPQGLDDRVVLGFATHVGDLVALVAEPADAETSVVVVDPADGRELWRSVPVPVAVAVGFSAVAGGDLDDTLLVVAADAASIYWLTEGNLHVEDSPHPDAGIRALAVGGVDGRPMVAVAPDWDGTVLVELHQVERQDDAAGGGLFRPRVEQGGAAAGAFDADPTAFDVFGSFPGRPDRYEDEHPEDWPRSAIAVGELDGEPVAVTGSLEGTAWLWDLGGPTPVARTGPFGTLSPFVRQAGWELPVKPPVPRSDAVALGHHPDHGPVIVVACDGLVRLHAVADRAPVEGPADHIRFVDAVDLGVICGRDVLVTGSKGGVISVWAMAPDRRLVAFTFDDPIAAVRVLDDDRIAVRTVTRRDYLLDTVLA